MSVLVAIFARDGERILRRNINPLVWPIFLFWVILLTRGTYVLSEPASNLIKGERLYRSYCLVCHGVDGKHTGPLGVKLNYKPADLSSKQYQMKEVKELAAIIGGYGRTEDSSMPNWGTVLPKTDLRDIAAYIAKLGREDFTYKGDSRRGRAIFKGACVACHGQFGRGKGILADLINIPMADFTDSEKMAQLSEEDIINAIKNGKGTFMASWENVLVDAEIIDVAVYIRSLTR